MIPGKFFTSFAKFQGIVNVNDFWFPIRGSKNFCKLLWGSCEVLFCAGRTVTTRSLSLVPPRHIDDCSAIHFLHFELCDLLKSNHQIFSARGTTPPLRLLQEALVIFVFKQISQFGSFGKCVNTLCSPEPGSTFARGSIGSS